MLKKKTEHKTKTYFSISDGLGGAEQLLFNLIKEELRSSQICFFKSKTTDAWEQAGVSTYYCNGDIFKFFKYCRSSKFNTILSSHLMMNASLGFLRTFGLLKTTKLICRESTSVFGRYKGWKLLKYKIAYWFGYRNIDLLITQSDLMKDTLLEHVPYLSDRIKTVTIPNLFIVPSNEVINESIDINKNSIVAAGRLIPEKGFDILIDVFVDIRKQYPEMNLVILGEGIERGKLELQIKELGLKDKVHLLGFVQNVYPYFKKAQIYAVSSRKEGFPNVLLQMMSQNTRVVSTLCAGGVEDIKGLEVCLPYDKNELYNALKKGIIKNISDEKKLFETELRSRSINSYIKSISKNLYEK